MGTEMAFLQAASESVVAHLSFMGREAANIAVAGKSGKLRDPHYCPPRNYY